MFKNVLLCTHGSEGAQKAEKYVFEKLLITHPDINITVLTIVDKDWSVMTGDDWLNTSGTRNRFFNYVDEQLGREISEDWDRIKDTYSVPDAVRFLNVTGDIEDTMCEVATQLDCDLIIIGPFQKKPFRLTSMKMSPGLAARIKNEKLHHQLPCPLLTAN
ncbi:universal stress protein [Desulfosediminicola flagellatus]|uniref:universal stress protein n=1 Tax=Desulfosediminicola flagellatus TaxID=2569541 RepID=UPI0010AC5778|nr:universal stress protein [Desulfosediminicola flagellatus]